MLLNLVWLSIRSSLVPFDRVYNEECKISICIIECLYIIVVKVIKNLDMIFFGGIFESP